MYVIIDRYDSMYTSEMSVDRRIIGRMAAHAFVPTGFSPSAISACAGEWRCTCSMQADACDKGNDRQVFMCQ